MTVRWSQRAQSDLAGIFAYITGENEEAAGRVLDRLYAAGQSLTQRTGGGPLRDHVPSAAR